MRAIFLRCTKVSKIELFVRFAKFGSYIDIVTDIFIDCFRGTDPRSLSFNAISVPLDVMFRLRSLLPSSRLPICMRKRTDQISFFITSSSTLRIVRIATSRPFPLMEVAVADLMDT